MGKREILDILNFGKIFLQTIIDTKQNDSTVKLRLYSLIKSSNFHTFAIGVRKYNTDQILIGKAQSFYTLASRTSDANSPEALTIQKTSKCRWNKTSLILYFRYDWIRGDG